MKATKQLFIAAALMAAAPAAVALDEAAQPGSQQGSQRGSQPGVVEAARQSAVATVEYVDHENRILTLRGPEGNRVTLEVGPDVKRLDEIKEGDRVKADYLESVAVVIARPEDPGAPVAAHENFLVRNPESRKPGATAVRTDVITATVEQINVKERWATLQGPDGGRMEISIAPDVPNLRNVKPGDQVVVERTRALALGIED